MKKPGNTSTTTQPKAAAAAAAVAAASTKTSPPEASRGEAFVSLIKAEPHGGALVHAPPVVGRREDRRAAPCPRAIRVHVHSHNGVSRSRFRAEKKVGGSRGEGRGASPRTDNATSL